MPAPVVIGVLSKLTFDISRWFLASALPLAAERLRPLIADPTSTIERLGDLIVWRGETGQKVIGLLGGITESQARIEGAVERIESAQVGMAGTLDTVLNLSLFNFGFGALGAGFMLARLKALNNRLTLISDSVAEIRDHIAAREKAELGNGLTLLDRYEQKGERHDLKEAFKLCNHSVLLHQALTAGELSGRQRLPVLNQSGRCYLVALLATARCRIHLRDLKEVDELVIGERPTTQALVRTTFDLVLGKSPEVYLEPGLQADAVTLDVLTEAYRQAHWAGNFVGEPVRDAGDLFERLRGRVFGASRGVRFTSASQVRRQLVSNLKYLIATVEDVNRVEAVRLRLAETPMLGSDPDALDREAERLRPSGQRNGPIAFALTDPL